MPTAIDRAIHGAGQGPLTKYQRCLLVARYIVPAHRARVVAGLAGPDMECWRREEQFKACRKEYLRECIQSDWPALCAHFLRILGRDREAAALDRRAACGGLAVARQKLREACAYARDAIEKPAEYAKAISKTRFKTAALEELSERQLWVLVFDLRRAAQRRRKLARMPVADSMPGGGHDDPSGALSPDGCNSRIVCGGRGERGA